MIADEPENLEATGSFDLPTRMTRDEFTSRYFAGKDNWLGELLLQAKDEKRKAPAPRSNEFLEREIWQATKP